MASRVRFAPNVNCWSDFPERYHDLTVFLTIEHPVNTVEIAHCVEANWQGNGYATEAAEAVTL